MIPTSPSGSARVTRRQALAGLATASALPMLPLPLLAQALDGGILRLAFSADPAGFDEWVAGGFANPAFLLLEPSAGRSGAVTVRDLAHVPPPSRATLVVGPEGGWTDRERTRAIEAGCAPLTLGPQAPRSGLLAEGYDADVLGVSANPLDDITVLTEPDGITHVWKAGAAVKEPTPA